MGDPNSLSSAQKGPLAGEIFTVASNMCSENISRHARFAVMIFVALTLALAFILTFASIYARTEGETRDSERFKQKAALTDADNEVTTAHNRLMESRLSQSDLMAKGQKVDATLARLHDPKTAASTFDKYNPDPDIGPMFPRSRSPEDLTDQLESYAANLKSRISESEKLVESYSQGLKTAQDHYHTLEQQFQSYKSPPLFSTEIMTCLIALIVIAVSVFTSLYRFHLREITKNEQFKVAFSRLNIANSVASAESLGVELTKSLVQDAFTIQNEAGGALLRRSAGRGASTTMQFMSPLPGHPTSELATSIVNKLLEQIDVILQPKPKTGRKGRQAVPKSDLDAPIDP